MSEDDISEFGALSSAFDNVIVELVRLMMDSLRSFKKTWDYEHLI